MPVPSANNAVASHGVRESERRTRSRRLRLGHHVCLLLVIESGPCTLHWREVKTAWTANFSSMLGLRWLDSDLVTCCCSCARKLSISSGICVSSQAHLGLRSTHCRRIHLE